MPGFKSLRLKPPTPLERFKRARQLKGCQKLICLSLCETLATLPSKTATLPSKTAELLGKVAVLLGKVAVLLGKVAVLLGMGKVVL